MYQFKLQSDRIPSVKIASSMCEYADIQRNLRNATMQNGYMQKQ